MNSQTTALGVARYSDTVRMVACESDLRCVGFLFQQLKQMMPKGDSVVTTKIISFIRSSQPRKK